MPTESNETKPRQFRLAQETLDLLDRIASHYGFRSRADAIRIAARLTVDQLPPLPEPKKKTPRKKKPSD